MEPMTLNLPGELADRLRKFAASNKMTAQDAVKSLLEAYEDEYGDYAKTDNKSASPSTGVN